VRRAIGRGVSPNCRTDVGVAEQTLNIVPFKSVRRELRDLDVSVGNVVDEQPIAALLSRRQVERPAVAESRHQARQQSFGSLPGP